MIVQNATPYTFFGRRQIELAEGATLYERRSGRGGPDAGERDRPFRHCCGGGCSSVRTSYATGRFGRSPRSTGCESAQRASACCRSRSTVITSVRRTRRSSGCFRSRCSWWPDASPHRAVAELRRARLDRRRRDPGAGLGPSASAAPHNCPVFPPDNPWNQRVDRLPVARDSAKLIASIGLDHPVHPDFGTVWDGSAQRDPVRGRHQPDPPCPRLLPVFGPESDHGRYPLPRGVPIEGGPGSSGDRHVIVVDRDTCTDYELFAAYPHDGGRYWTAGSGAIFNCCARTICARRAGPPRTRPVCRSCRGSLASEVAAGSIDWPRPAVHGALHSTTLRLPGAAFRLHLRRLLSRRWDCEFLAEGWTSTSRGSPTTGSDRR